MLAHITQLFVYTMTYLPSNLQKRMDSIAFKKKILGCSVDIPARNKRARCSRYQNHYLNIYISWQPVGDTLLHKKFALSTTFINVYRGADEELNLQADAIVKSIRFINEYVGNRRFSTTNTAYISVSSIQPLGSSRPENTTRQ